MTNIPKTKINSSIQEHLPIKEIREDVVVLKDGSYRGVIMVQPQNFGLKSEGEKDSVIFSFQSFLNSLEFPVQITSVSRTMDLNGYIRSVRDRSSQETHPLIKLQIESYADFINTLIEKINVMDRQFFITVPYYPGGAAAIKPLGKKQEGPKTSFSENRSALMERVRQIAGGVSNINLRCSILKTGQLIELFYALYNPDTARTEKLTVALTTMRNDEDADLDIRGGV